MDEARRDRLEIFALSFVSLYLELALVRWLSSYVAFLGFFSNLILLGCFLGLSLGILGCARRFRLLHLAPGALTVTVCLAIGLHYAYLNLKLGVSVADPQSPSLVYFGSESRVLDSRYTIVPIEALAGAFFLMSAVVFAGVGQELGRRFETYARPLTAYLVNLFASVLGVVGFMVVSWQRLSPVWWFGPAVLALLPFLPGRRRLRALHAATLLAAAAIAGAVGLGAGFKESEVRWSPYYQVRYDPGSRHIDVNGLGHQTIYDVPEQKGVYRLPHALLAAAGRPARRMLVIGAGSGNDVSQALANGVESVDAVDIDPTILELGRLHHPARPYQDPRVRVVNDDGRSFLRRTGRTYDTVVYALVDSLASHSSYASIRLESYLMTRQAFEAVRARLEPGGVFVMYNFFRQGFVVSRLATTLEDVFGSPPLVLSLPPRDRISADRPESGVSILIAGGTGPLERLFAERGRLCLPAAGPHAPGDVARFGDAECAGGVLLEPVAVDSSPASLLPTDDWPFLYLRERRIPGHVLVMNGLVLAAAILLLALLSPPASAPGPAKVSGWQRFTPSRQDPAERDLASAPRVDAHFLLLGAGFMLLETRSIVQLALVYGATWLTTAVVVLAILVTATLATLLVRAAGVTRRAPAYALLCLCLLANYALPATSLVGVAEPWRTAAVFLLVGLPVFFAGIVFAVSFGASTAPARDFGSNIAGVVIGALAENASLLVGFRSLLLLALAFYALSALALLRRRAAAVQELGMPSRSGAR